MIHYVLIDKVQSFKQNKIDKVYLRNPVQSIEKVFHQIEINVEVALSFQIVKLDKWLLLLFLYHVKTSICQ